MKIEKSLDLIFCEHGTDKSSKGHFYSTTYGMLFSDLRYNTGISLLEIGIDKGDSLRAWEEYFTNAQIYGVDIIDCKKDDSARIKTFIGSQTDAKFLDGLFQEIDPKIIIDDGSHDSKDQIFSFEYLFPKLKSGGYYCIEDILCSYDGWGRWNQGENVMDRIRQMVGEVQMNGNIPGSALCANKFEAVKKYQGSYFDMNIQWMFLACGVCVIKKL